MLCKYIYIAYGLKITKQNKKDIDQFLNNEETKDILMQVCNLNGMEDGYVISNFCDEVKSIDLEKKEEFFDLDELRKTLKNTLPKELEKYNKDLVFGLFSSVC